MSGVIGSSDGQTEFPLVYIISIDYYCLVCGKSYIVGLFLYFKKRGGGDQVLGRERERKGGGGGGKHSQCKKTSQHKCSIVKQSLKKRKRRRILRRVNTQQRDFTDSGSVMADRKSKT